MTTFDQSSPLSVPLGLVVVGGDGPKADRPLLGKRSAQQTFTPATHHLNPRWGW
jgi:hypothetical protein